MEASTVGGVAAGAAPLTMNVPSEGRPDFCIEVDDEDDSQLLHDGVGQVQEQNNRLLEVFKKTQQNRKNRGVSVSSPQTRILF
jgi:hypothetical protein